MGVITISRGSYSKGKEIAEKLAEKLGYECISRNILLETSVHFNIPQSIKNSHLPFYTTEMKDLIYHMKGIWEIKE